jgi:pimeloyl-ACP methyl ester carboxylesterase
MLPRRTALILATPLRPLLTALPVLTALGALTVLTGAGATTAQAGPPRAAELAPAVADQVLTWKPCLDRDEEPGFPRTYYRQQCTTLTAPEDWADPGGATIRLHVTRLPATHRPAQGVLFTNPGGPGAAGADLPLVFGEVGRKPLLRGQDVYGIDPRGAGQSDNVTCGDAFGVDIDPRVRTQADVNLMLDAAALVARACDVAGGTYLSRVDTAETVRDLDLLRSLIKAPTVNWLGYSAGTWLGAAYATAYPEHTGRFVFDSTVDFTGTWQDAFELQPLGFQRRFDEDFAPWAARNHEYLKLGTTPAAVKRSYERIRAGLDPRRSLLTAPDLDGLLAGAMYSGDSFPLAAFVLDLAADGGLDGPAGQTLQSAVRRLEQSVPATLSPFANDAENAAFLAVTCNDTAWTQDRASLVTTSARLGQEYPLIGWSTISQPCVFWNRRQRTLPLPTPSGAGVPSSLFVQSEHDPATPIEGARRAAAAFAGSHLLVVTNEGDHGLYAGGNSCVDRTVERYLNDGTLPKDGATCPGKPLPAVGDLSAGSARARAVNPLVRLARIERE